MLCILICIIMTLIGNIYSIISPGYLIKLNNWHQLLSLFMILYGLVTGIMITS